MTLKQEFINEKVEDTQHLIRGNKGVFRTKKQVKALASYIWEYDGYNDYEVMVDTMDVEHIFDTFSIILTGKETYFTSSDEMIFRIIVAN